MTMSRPATREVIQARYDCPAAVLYKQVLKARADGRPEPTDLTNTNSNTDGSKKPIQRKMEGFGNTAPPRPTLDGSVPLSPKQLLWAVPAVAAAAVAYVILSHHGG